MKMLKKIAVLMLLFMASITCKASDNDSETLDDLTLEQNITQLEVPAKYHQAVVNEMQKVADLLRDEGLNNVSTERNEEVLVVTISAADIFEPNDSVVSASGKHILDKFVRFLQQPDMFRLLLDMHSDNTGSDEYLKRLTEMRVLDALNYFEQKKDICADYVIPYAEGAEKPIIDNKSMHNRAINRRLEIYIVPGKKMLEVIKNGETII